MIERNNIIKLLSGRTNVYHSAVLTCYTFDPIYFESIYLPTLRMLGITNVIVLMDSSMYDELLVDSSYQYHRVTISNYTLVRQENSHLGVFHPKMALLFGEEEGVLIVGSGNLTFSGLSNNEEVWNVFHVQDNDSIHYPLLHKAWMYVSKVTKNTPTLVQKQLKWITEQSLWLQKACDDEAVELKSGEICSLLFNSSNTSILNDLYKSIGDTKIRKITIVAPFFDTSGNVIKELQERLSPDLISCVLDLERQSAPYDLLKGNDSQIKFHKHTASNPLHAKIIEIQSDDKSWLLSGSANAGTLALGGSPNAFNDEVCILLQSNKQKDYIKELGLEFSELTFEERRAIEKPLQNQTNSSSKKVTLISCEIKDDTLFLRFNKSGIEGTLHLLDSSQGTSLYQETIITDDKVTIVLKGTDSESYHVAVLRTDKEDISNRILVIKETNVESCNPDPKRRKLSSLLNDSELLENLSHILGYIEFEETDNQKKTYIVNQTSSNKKIDDDVIVTRDRFNELKDSALSISMHSGVRILAFLGQILFKKEQAKNTDDDLLGLNEEDGIIMAQKVIDETEVIERTINEATKLRSDIISFLKRMQQSLMNKTSDVSIHGSTNPAVNRPRLMATPGLNAASSLAIAARSVICLMNKYGDNVEKPEEIRNLLVKCAGLFFSLYSNSYPSEDNRRSQKVIEMIKDASIDLLSALSFFYCSKKNSELTQLILNCLDSWKGKSELNDILPAYEQQLNKLNSNYLDESSIQRILEIANTHFSQPVQQDELSMSYSTIYFYRQGYGFLVVDEIKKTGNQWSYTYHSPWFEERVNNITARMFKGYADI